jgi:outer membrane protein assembly factor BamB
VKRRLLWISVLVLLLPLIASCGRDRFSAHGWAGLTIDGDVLYVAAGEGRVTALNISRDAGDNRGNPERLWTPFPADGQDNLGAVYGAPLVGAFAEDGVVGSTTIFLATYENPEDDDDISANLFAIDATTGTQNWAASVPGPVVGSPTLVGNTLVVGTTHGLLYALAIEPDERALPRSAWREFEADGKVWSAATVADGTLYFGSLGHTVYAVNATDGTEIWSYEVGGAVVGSPLVMDGTVYVGALDRSLYALDANTGEQKWKFSGDNWFWAAPVSDGRTIYAATLGGTVYAIDLLGREVWSSPTEVSGSVLAAPVVLSNTLIVATDNKQVHQLSLSDGREEWSIGIGEMVRADIVSQGERVYIIDTEGVVHALDADRRIELWTYPTR